MHHPFVYLEMTQMSDFVVVARVADVPVGSAIEVQYAGNQVGLFNVKGTLHAIGNVCTHAYAELHEGYVDDDDCTVDCPLHGARFSLTTGHHLTLPAVRAVRLYQVRVEGDDIAIAPHPDSAVA